MDTNTEIEKTLLTCPRCGKKFFVYKPRMKTGECLFCFYQYRES